MNGKIQVGEIQMGKIGKGKIGKGEKMNYRIRQGTSNDVAAIEALLPRLADFDVPVNRTPEQLWHGDRDLVRQWAQGTREDVDVAVAVCDDTLIGVAVNSARKELLNGEPSVHLEILALHASAEGHGVGSALMQESESMALSRGARSISLHVFTANVRARALYERQGYEGELIRYFKPLR